MVEISGDNPLNTKDKFYFFIYNFIRGIAGLCSRIEQKYWHPQRLDDGKETPARKYLNQFIVQEVFKAIPIKNIDILDIGCGSGYVRKVLGDFGCKGRYVGVDIYKNKDFDRYTNVNGLETIFIKSKIEDFETEGKFDFILSITVLEHVENDKIVVTKCNNLLKEGGCQIHIIPSFWALFLYLWHGYRQYTPKRIKELFSGTEYQVFRLGGLFSFFLHLFYITFPAALFKIYTVRAISFYSKLVNLCNKLDKYLPILPSFYVVIAKKV